MQQKFSYAALVLLLLIPASLLLTVHLLRRLPDRAVFPDRIASVRFKSIKVAGTNGAWAVSVNDPRFGGTSALVLDGRRLLALTDSGVLVTLPRPGEGRSALLHDLPGGPGPAGQRRWRDSEALVRTTSGHWLVAFENRHSIWRFDPAFSSGQPVADLTRQGWPLNKGVEGMVMDSGGQALLLVESGRTLLHLRASGLTSTPLRSAGEIADAVRLRDGRTLVLVRQVGLAGVANWLGQLDQGRGRATVRLLHRFAVGPLTNLEGIAAEPLPSGATRLWIISDNDFSSLRRTILLTVDLPRR